MVCKSTDINQFFGWHIIHYFCKKKMTFDITDTICALSTPAGTGAIALVRISGPESKRILSKIFFDKNTLQSKTLKPRTATFGILQFRNEIIDEVVVTWFPQPHSYTGQDVIEISCHGSSYIQRKIMQSLIELGCRTALPGEFTMRAFFNGKMDLTQAESVANLISARNATAHRVAISQMKGSFSKRLNMLSEKLVHLLSLVELELDFGDEDVEFADRSQLQQLISEIDSETKSLVNSYGMGQAIKNGIPVVIVGHPNAGKSTLLNKLLQEERAIVSDIPGTTRDAIEDTITFENLEFRFIDTAGLRKSTDQIENLGMERSLEKASTAWIVLFLFDCSENIENIIHALQSIQQKINTTQKIIPIANKIDLLTDPVLTEKLATVANTTGISQESVLKISAKSESGIPNLISTLVKTAAAMLPDEDAVVINNTRQYELLLKIHQALSNTQEAMAQALPSDILAFELRRVQTLMGELTGKVIDPDTILGNIFKNFCIGK